MAGVTSRRSPSLLAMAVAWFFSASCELGWSVGLYNFDGEMGDTPPPPIGSSIVAAAWVGTAVVAVAWLACRLRGPTTGGFWLFLLGSFAAKGLLAAGLEEGSVLAFGAAPFTVAGSYKDEGLKIATALASGIVVALIVKAIDRGRTPQIERIATLFD